MIDREERGTRRDRRRRRQRGGRDTHSSRGISTRRVLLVVLLLVLGAGALAAYRILARQPYTVVLVVVDTVRRDSLGCYGHPRNPTPHIDALAAEGIRFDTAISTSGWTLPAMGSLVTGAWPTIHGAMGKQVILAPTREELPTIAEILSEEGYNTLGFANAAFVSPMLGFGRGFDVFSHRHAYTSEVRRADETIRAAVSAIRARRSEANFVFIHLFDPHLNYDPPPGYETKFAVERKELQPPLGMQDIMDLTTDGGKGPPVPADIAYVQAIYQGEINFVDEQIGNLVHELKKMGLYDRTLLIVTADHGEESWEHNGFEHGHTLYDELIRIPLVIKLPAEIRPARRIIDTQVRILDIAPTVLDLLDMERPESFAGRSLMPLIMGQSSDDRIAYVESTLYGTNKLAWREKRFKYILDLNPETEVPVELYDLEADPGETNNLVAARPMIAHRLRADLINFHNDLAGKSKTMSTPEIIDMSPDVVENLKSLGYIR